MRYLGMNVFFLYFMSMYSVPKETHIILKFLLYFWRFICILGLSSLACLCLLDIYLRDDYVFVEISSNILNAGIFTSGTIRLIYFYMYEGESKMIVGRLNELFRDQSNTGMHKEKNMKLYRNICIGITLYWSVMVFFTGEFTALLPLAFLEKNGKSIPIQAYYPYDWKADGWYEFTMFTQALTQFFMGFSYGNSDLFFVCCLFLTSGQFKLLAWEFENVIYSALIDYGFDKDRVVAFSKTFNAFGADGRMNDGSDGTDKESCAEYLEMVEVIKSEDFAPILHRRLVGCIVIHQDLLNFSKTLDVFFSPVLLPIISFGLFYMIFIPFTLLVSTDKSSFMGLSEYLIMAVAEVFFLSTFGQILTNESERLKDAMYNAPWYLCKKNYMTTLMFSQFKTSEQVVMKAGSYFVMGHDLFISICKTAGSYFAVLRQVTE